MKQIESYVDEVYNRVGGNKKEIEELKAELKSHLIEAVHELKAEGMNEQEAIAIAIERFGGEQEMHSIVSQLFKGQKVFAKWVLFLAIICFVTTVTVFGVALSNDGNQYNTKLSSDKATFELSTELRGITTDITGDSGHAIYTKVMLNVSGEHIDSITYTISKGKFLKDVILTAKEEADKDWLLSEKIVTIGNSPGSDIYSATKDIGNTYTVKYNEQDKYKYSIAIPHDGNLVIDDDIIIKVIIKYTDGNSEQQDIVVTQESNSIESNSISLKLK
ncbi:permease prefix domain 1-containing protein [Psychrobacillus sp. L3]|uniref:permease prefix domain 1-containing protein n=1 Tax=Psychrobacillus sp. L3 TaxID=3236891 RepID=UPI0036F43E0C